MAAERKNWFHAAGLIWPPMTAAAKSRATLRYKELGEAIGIHHRHVNKALGPIQDYCLETKRPPLTALVVNATGLPGQGFIAWDIDNIDAALDAVYAYNWDAVSNPFGQLGTADSKEELVRRLVDHPDEAEAVYRLVPDRGVVQQLFRAAVAEAYGYKCAFCKCSFSNALEAAHIIRWKDATPQQKLDVRNGILLCATHHRMFDSALIAPTSKYTVQYCDPEEEEGGYSSADTALSSALHGEQLHLPSDKKLWPLQQLIEERLRDDEWP
jgi:putative restriction endonuclease